MNQNDRQHSRLEQKIIIDYKIKGSRLKVGSLPAPILSSKTDNHSRKIRSSLLPLKSSRLAGKLTLCAIVTDQASFTQINTPEYKTADSFFRETLQPPLYSISSQTLKMLDWMKVEGFKPTRRLSMQSFQLLHFFQPPKPIYESIWIVRSTHFLSLTMRVNKKNSDPARNIKNQLAGTRFFATLKNSAFK